MQRRHRNTLPTPALLERLEPRELFSFSKLPILPKPTPSRPSAPPTPTVSAAPVARQTPLRAYIGESFYQLITNIPGNAYQLPNESHAGIPIKISINYGDGTTADAITGRNGDGSIYISSLHTYKIIGTLKLTIIATPQNGARPITLYTNAINVTRISDNGRLLSTRGRTISGILGTVNNPGNLGKLNAPATTASRPATPSQTAASYSVIISWGDGSDALGLLRSNKTGTYDVLGSHTYAKPGVYAISINDGLTITYAIGGGMGVGNQTVAASLALIGVSTGNGLPWRNPIPDLQSPAISLININLVPIRTGFLPIPFKPFPIFESHILFAPTVPTTGSLSVSGSYTISRPSGNASTAVVTNGVTINSAGTLTLLSNSQVTLNISPNALIGDADLSGNVDLGDFDKWFKNVSKNPYPHAGSDFDLSGIVDLGDFDTWFKRTITATPSSTIS